MWPLSMGSSKIVGFQGFTNSTNKRSIVSGFVQRGMHTYLYAQMVNIDYSYMF